MPRLTLTQDIGLIDKVNSKFQIFYNMKHDVNC